MSATCRSRCPRSAIEILTRERDYWTPKNYDNGSSGILTLRLGLENSKNLVTAQLLSNGIYNDPEQSLAQVCELAIEAQVYRDCIGYYPFVLGAQPVRLIDLAAFYAAIANEGFRPSPYAIELVEQAGKIAFRHKPELKAIANGDRVAFVQLKSMLQGVLARGTARAAKHLSPYVAGKTGTSDGENDAWFVGFSNDVTIAVWIGYDNADGKRRTLGRGQTGAKAALPIFMTIMDAVWADYAKKTPLSPPSPAAQRQLIALPIDLRSGIRVADNSPGAITEYFRLDRTGGLTETQYTLVSRSRGRELHLSRARRWRSVLRIRVRIQLRIWIRRVDMAERMVTTSAPIRRNIDIPGSNNTSSITDGRTRSAACSAIWAEPPSRAIATMGCASAIRPSASIRNSPSPTVSATRGLS